jgi:hypothetical protein
MGYVLTRAYETTSAAPLAKVIYDRGTFTYESGLGKSGRVDRELPLYTGTPGRVEHSEGSCQVERACPDAPRTPVNSTLARCQLGNGVAHWPAIFLEMRTAPSPITDFGPWLLQEQLYWQRYDWADISQPVRDVVCCDGCGAELSCLNNGG